jgi:hypothetical protein
MGAGPRLERNILLLVRSSLREGRCAGGIHVPVSENDRRRCGFPAVNWRATDHLVLEFGDAGGDLLDDEEVRCVESGRAVCAASGSYRIHERARGRGCAGRRRASANDTGGRVKTGAVVTRTMTATGDFDGA